MLKVFLNAAHKHSRETCGPKRPQQDDEQEGLFIGVHQIKCLSKKLGIRCRQKRKSDKLVKSKVETPR